MSIANTVMERIQENGRCECEDLCAFTVLFAVFFDAKQEFDYEYGSLRAMHDIVKRYAAYPTARREFQRLALMRYAKGCNSLFWKVGTWGLALLMALHWYWLCAFGCKLIALMKIDKALSSTGNV